MELHEAENLVAGITWSPPVPLPHGPHGFSLQEVEANQRERCIRAFAEVLRRNGGGMKAATVQMVLDLSKVSRRAFYELFPDGKRQLLLEACKFAGAYKPPSDWRERAARAASTPLFVPA